MARDFVVKEEEKEFSEAIVSIKRVAKVVKGGRRFRFTALVVVGNKKGVIGFGTGKAAEVPDAIKKAVIKAQANTMTVPIKDTTVPQALIGHYGSGQVFIKPAPKGSGIIAGGALRSIFSLAGINDVSAKILGSRTAINVVRAAFEGLSKMRTAEKILSDRSLTKEEE
ncbi:MAG: 30S ribosomal protein S5 [Acholeplasmatales bacterium]|jgi:small subunit ribosomal protein S5|nr:30S ribosomal protein S5 [Acholeplasmatales bacterium]